jgi:hypothetical protein
MVAFDDSSKLRSGPGSTANPALSDEWRRSIADGWRRMLPHVRRRVERLQQQFEAEQDVHVRFKLEVESARRRDVLRKAEAALGGAEAHMRGEMREEPR